MSYYYPRPQNVGIEVPVFLRQERFCAGFEHALKGGRLSKVEYLRRFFRLGYRAAKLYVRELRRQQGILSFPIRGRFRVKAILRRSGRAANKFSVPSASCQPAKVRPSSLLPRA